MTPAARVSAAIEVVDLILSGETAEKALTSWGRSHRFAGSKDRAAIRDHVFQALRCQSSYVWLGGASTGRGIMIGAMRSAGVEDEMFSGEGYGPAPIRPDENGARLDSADRSVQYDMPNWMLPFWDDSFGSDTPDILNLMQTRAGVFLRVNSLVSDQTKAIAALAEDNIVATPVPGVKTALQVLENERRVSNSNAYLNGVVELQDPSSQQAVHALNITSGLRVLDYCAGGGGKALALAAAGGDVTAHDVNPKRMGDIGPRAQRAGVHIEQLETKALTTQEPYDLVFCDAPCSGSGTWRRTPAAKWGLTPERLSELNDFQDDVIENGAKMVKDGGRLVYATCSVFAQENTDRVSSFLSQNADFSISEQTLIRPSSCFDGFFYTILVRK